jgi:uncharacterized protein (TIGR03118 family)
MSHLDSARRWAPSYLGRSALALVAATLFVGQASGQGYQQVNIVSDIQGLAEHFDPNLKDPWGVSFSTGSPFWVSDQASNFTGASGTTSPVTTLYSVNGNAGNGPIGKFTPVGLIVNVPNQGNAPADAGANGPTGQVATGAPGITTNSKTDFQVVGPGGTGEAAFIFANMDGSISAWAGTKANGTLAQIETSVAGASFTGLAIANDASGPLLYAADQNSNKIDIFDSKWQMKGSFTDPNGLPAGFNAFNVQNINGTIFVTFTDQTKPGGIVDEFATDGTFIKRLIDDPNGNHLFQPWGLVMAPKSFGQFGGDLLVGNNGGDNWINAYNPNTGAWDGFLKVGGKPFSEGDLWALTFGNGTNGGDKNTLYFTAGLDSQVDGLFGAIRATPEPSTGLLGLLGAAVIAGWRLRSRRRAQA